MYDRTVLQGKCAAIEDNIAIYCSRDYYPRTERINIPTYLAIDGYCSIEGHQRTTHDFMCINDYCSTKGWPAVDTIAACPGGSF
jgi:hypothetical protein